MAKICPHTKYDYNWSMHVDCRALHSQKTERHTKKNTFWVSGNLETDISATYIILYIHNLCHVSKKKIVSNFSRKYPLCSPLNSKFRHVVFDMMSVLCSISSLLFLITSNFTIGVKDKTQNRLHRFCSM